MEKIYKICDKGIIILDKSDFNPAHILECGQVFSFCKNDEEYHVFPQDKYAVVKEQGDHYLILTSTPQFFIKYFDLDNNYHKIKATLLQHEILRKPIEFGYGIRILKQNLFEMLISFIISANNNIKRIQLILGRLREKLGTRCDYGYAFPTQKQMLNADLDVFYQIGAGYRAPYIYKVLRQIKEEDLTDWDNLPTEILRKNLLSLCGVGLKVADCILLFGYGRSEVFPVDTWIHQMYNHFYSPIENREKIRKNLIQQFGNLSGYAQQYLFYYQRSESKT